MFCGVRELYHPKKLASKVFYWDVLREKKRGMIPAEEEHVVHMQECRTRVGEYLSLSFSPGLWFRRA